VKPTAEPSTTNMKVLHKERGKAFGLQSQEHKGSGNGKKVKVKIAKASKRKQ
jgi:hypothetical protein